MHRFGPTQGRSTRIDHPVAVSCNVPVVCKLLLCLDGMFYDGVRMSVHACTFGCSCIRINRPALGGAERNMECDG